MSCFSVFARPPEIRIVSVGGIWLGFRLSCPWYVLPGIHLIRKVPRAAVPALGGLPTILTQEHPEE